MIPLLSTLAPAVLILAAAYPLRPQGGRMRPNAVPAHLILARLADDPDRTGPFGDTRRAPAFTVQTRRTLWTTA